MMREQLEAGPVELLRKQLFRDRHADRIRDALPSGPVVVSAPGVTPYSG